jgi:hypothetical protein
MTGKKNSPAIFTTVFNHWTRTSITIHYFRRNVVICRGAQKEETGFLTCLSFLGARMGPAGYSFGVHVWLAHDYFVLHLFGGRRLHNDMLLVHHLTCLPRLRCSNVIVIHLKQNDS